MPAKKKTAKGAAKKAAKKKTAAKAVKTTAKAAKSSASAASSKKAAPPPKKAATKPRKGTLVPRSTVSDILGAIGAAVTNHKPKVPTKWAKNYKNLFQLRDDLKIQSGHLAEEASEEGATHSMHMADSGTDSFDRDFALSLLSAEQESLLEIEEAIRRIENGTYGVCQMTGETIDKERLAAIPWTRFSYASQQQLEKDGAVSKAHFGALGTLHGSDARDRRDDSDDTDGKPPVAKVQQ